jgi:hypothetical protein
MLRHKTSVSDRLLQSTRMFVRAPPVTSYILCRHPPQGVTGGDGPLDKGSPPTTAIDSNCRTPAVTAADSAADSAQMPRGKDDDSKNVPLKT